MLLTINACIRRRRLCAKVVESDGEKKDGSWENARMRRRSTCTRERIQHDDENHENTIYRLGYTNFLKIASKCFSVLRLFAE